MLRSLAVLIFLSISSNAAESVLWGKNGEKWDTTIIPDFTRAGYRSGLVAIPVFTEKVNVKTLGASGNGVSDDTRFFRQAIAQCGENGAVLVPAGTYLLTDSLIIGKKGVVVRGEGQGKTVLYLSKGLEELYPQYNVTTPNQTPWSWSGALIRFKGAVTDVGIEDLTIRFPDSAWAGHNFHERGYNAIGFDGCSHGWVRNVTITGADVGIWIAQSARNITADRWTFNFGPVRRATAQNGHHGVNCYGGYNLFGNFVIDGKFCHDLSLESQKSRFNVFMKGKGTDLCFDHHSEDYNQRYNLFTEIDIGAGTRMYESGGNLTPRGVSFYETWWNIQSINAVRWVSSMGPSTNNVEVGLKNAESQALPDSNHNWFEAVAPGSLVPPNLYLAQMQVLHPTGAKQPGFLPAKHPEERYTPSTDGEVYSIIGRRIGARDLQTRPQHTRKLPPGLFLRLDKNGMGRFVTGNLP